MRKLFSIPVFVGCMLTACFAHAQKQYNVWAFGKKGGINFNTIPPSGFKSNSPEKEPPYYLSSICDKDGHLMFYTDGIDVFSRDGYKMPKYNNWWPLAGNVMPLVTNRPGSDTLFYLFAISNAANPYELQAFPLRLKASGDVDEMIYPRPTAPNTFQKRLQKKCSMMLAGTTHCNQRDYWICTYAAHTLVSFLVTPAGVQETPVVTTVPESVVQDSTIDPGYSNMKFSANGEKIAFPDLVHNRVVIYNFDNLTGKFSDPLIITTDAQKELEEFELSPDGSKLYTSEQYRDPDFVTPPTQHEVNQYDLDAGTLQAIEATRTTVTPNIDLESCTRATCFFIYRTMNVGPDGKMYISMRYATRETIPIDQTFSVVEYPNAKGINCTYKKYDLQVGRKYFFAGYNYIRSVSYTPKENGITVIKQNCADQPVTFDLLFKKIDSVRWDFGEPSSGSQNFSAAPRPQHQYGKPGSYTVTALIYSRCITDTARTVITIHPDITVHVPASIKDTTICYGETLVLNARTGTATAYQWENGNTQSARSFTEPGKYQVKVSNACSFAYTNFEIKTGTCPCNVYVPDAFTPNGDGLNDVFKPSSQCYARDFRFTVFNRFGQVVFSTTDISKGWNGYSDAYPQATGTFIWTLQYQDPNTRQKISRKGSVLLIR